MMTRRQHKGWWLPLLMSLSLLAGCSVAAAQEIEPIMPTPVRATKIVQAWEGNITVAAPPGAECTLTFLNPRGLPIPDATVQGQRTVNEKSHVWWSWRLPHTKRGVARVTVSCTPGGEATTIVTLR